MKTWIALISLLAALPAGARLGETEEQLIARYGEGRPGEKADQWVFQKNGITIEATLWKGVCHSIFYHGPRPIAPRIVPPPSAGQPSAPLIVEPPVDPHLPEAWKSPLTQSQIAKLIELNRGDTKWKDSGGDVQSTEDGRRFARAFAGSVTIYTKDFSEFQRAREKAEEDRRIAEEEKRLDGF